jgi:hypothetical protein
MSEQKPILSGLLNGLLLVSGLLYSTMHLRVALSEKPILEKQAVLSAQALTEVKALQGQADEAIAKREEQLKLASQTETQYAALLTELLDLAKVDPDARTITNKWKIQQQGASQEAPPATDAGKQAAPPKAKPPAAPAGAANPAAKGAQ